MRLPLPGGRALARDAVAAAAMLPPLARTGLLRPPRPDRLLGMGLALARYGVTPAAGYAVGAARHPDRLAVVAEDGTATYAEVHHRSDRLAVALRRLGVGPGDAVGLLARNSLGFVLVVAAAGKLGADVVYLNTGFAGPALADALDGEGVGVVVHDAEFGDVLADAVGDRPRVVLDGDDGSDAATLARLLATPAEPLPRPPREGRQVILTSGTTGRAKGAARSAPPGLAGLEPFAGVLDAIPFRAGGTTVLAAPMFHAWGLLNLTLSLILGRTLVLARRFDPAATLAQVATHHADGLVVVPVMLQRILALPEADLRRVDTGSLRIVASSGSAMPVAVARRTAEVFGDVLHDLYGSTEVAFVSIARPVDHREAPGSVGRPVRGTVVRLLDDDGQPVPQGGTGRIFVGSSMTFGGYTGGQDKQRVDGLVATGDVGRFDDAGRLWVEGRDDDMIVSGGENVFPGEIEEVLLDHPDVADAAVVGVPDEEYGARLVAHVVAAPGRDLDPEALRRHVRDQLARHKVPREVVVTDELPRNATGKVLRRELRGE